MGRVTSSSTTRRRKAGRRQRQAPPLFYESEAERILAKLDRLDKRILIEIYREPINARMIAERVSSSEKEVRQRLHSRSRVLSKLIKELNGEWYLTDLGIEACELLKNNPLFKGFFY